MIIERCGNYAYIIFYSTSWRVYLFYKVNELTNEVSTRYRIPQNWVLQPCG